jgi:hypothetical protein
MGTKYKQGRRIALVLALLLVVNTLYPAFAHAGNLSNTYVRLNRMSQATATTFRVVFTTTASPGSVNQVSIDFSTAWNAASTAGLVGGTQSASSASCAAETGATALPGTLTASTTTANRTITVAGVTSLSATTAYCVDLTNASAVTTPSAGSYYVTVATQNTGSIIDSSKVNIPIVSNDSITVTASVPPLFTFALDANSTAFTADLSPGTKQTTTPRTVTVNTNAKTGWVAWLRDGNASVGLHSTGVNYTVSPTTPGTAVNVDTTPNVEQYVWGVTASTQVAGVGSTTLIGAYDATGGTNEGSGVDATYRQIASGSGTAQNAVLTLAAAATISPITPAASDYTDTIQVIGAGNF